MAAVAWLLTAVYYFYQYALRSAPAVMMPQSSEAFGLGPLGVASIVGLFYYGYSPFSLVAGAAMDRLGPRRLLPAAAAVVGLGALLFATGSSEIASIGRFLQRLSSGAGPMEPEHYQTAFTPLLYGVALAIVLVLLLKERGPAGAQKEVLR
jgi:MFS family permease